MTGAMHKTVFLNGPVIVYYAQRMKLTVVYSWLIYDSTTFTSCENVLKFLR